MRWLHVKEVAKILGLHETQSGFTSAVGFCLLAETSGDIVCFSLRDVKSLKRVRGKL